MRDDVVAVMVAARDDMHDDAREHGVDGVDVDACMMVVMERCVMMMMMMMMMMTCKHACCCCCRLQ
jgi:hypothetical protein